MPRVGSSATAGGAEVRRREHVNGRDNNKQKEEALGPNPTPPNSHPIHPSNDKETTSLRGPRDASQVRPRQTEPNVKRKRRLDPTPVGSGHIEHCPEGFTVLPYLGAPRQLLFLSQSLENKEKPVPKTLNRDPEYKDDH